MTLHLTKVAVGCKLLGELEERLQERVGIWQERKIVPVLTRYRPKRYEALIGGSLYWIIRHTLVARQEILGFEEDDSGEKPRCRIILDAQVVPVAARRKRAHQGWRYMEPSRAPRDLAEPGADLSELPTGLIRELSGLGLV